MMSGMPELVSAVSTQLRGKDVVSPWTVHISYSEASQPFLVAAPQGQKTPFAKLSSNAQVDGIAGKYTLSWTETDGGRVRKLRVTFEDQDSACDVLVQKIKAQVDKWAVSYIEVIESSTTPSSTSHPQVLSRSPVTLSSRVRSSSRSTRASSG